MGHTLPVRVDTCHPTAAVEQSPGMVLLAEQVAHLGDVSFSSSRSKILTASRLDFGQNTEAIREAAAASAISFPIAGGASELLATEPIGLPPVFDGNANRIDGIVERLSALMPLQSFVEMAGGQAAYDATPLHERQIADRRTLRKAVGRNGDTGVRIISYIQKLHEYRRKRGIEADLWPVYPAILANFAVYLQCTSPKENATSVAQRCISTLSSAAMSIKLPIFVDSPHLGSVPLHQSSGDGWTGHLPLDIAAQMEQFTLHNSAVSEAFRFDARCAYTIWRG